MSNAGSKGEGGSPAVRHTSKSKHNIHTDLDVSVCVRVTATRRVCVWLGPGLFQGLRDRHSICCPRPPVELVCRSVAVVLPVEGTRPGRQGHSTNDRRHIQGLLRTVPSSDRRIASSSDTKRGSAEYYEEVAYSVFVFLKELYIILLFFIFYFLLFFSFYLVNYLCD